MSQQTQKETQQLNTVFNKTPPTVFMNLNLIVVDDLLSLNGLYIGSLGIFAHA